MRATTKHSGAAGRYWCCHGWRSLSRIDGHALLLQPPEQLHRRRGYPPPAAGGPTDGAPPPTAPPPSPSSSAPSTARRIRRRYYVSVPFDNDLFAAGGPLLLPAIEDGIFSDNWRIRQSSVELLGDLLFKVAGTSGKAILEGGSDDEGASTEAQGRAIIEVLGREKRNEVLAAIYMVRSDVSLTVRQAALHVWKTIVANTPRTLKEIMPVLMDTLISSLASSSSERRQVAGRSLGELVRKLGERVLPSIIPILSQGLKDPSASRRQGVCIGLSEVMGSVGKHQLLSFMGELIPTIRTALCDSTQEVRESAGLAFSTLYKSAGLQAIDEIVPTLLRALEDDDTSATALDGLKQILSVRTAAVLPHILPKLVQPPLSSFNAHAFGALAEVAGPGLNSHIGTVLPALILAMDDEDADVQNSARKAAETVLLVIDEEGVETLIPELLRGINDSQASMRRGSAYLIGFLFKNTKLYLADEASDVMSTLIILLSDTDKATVSAALEAFSRVVASVPKEQLPTHIKLVRDAVSTARDKERRRRKGVPILVPGLCLPKALQPFLPIFQQGLISGSAETKEQAAEGLGELIDVTSEKTLKEVVVPITGPLICILGDRFPWQVKSAILSTLTIIIMKGGIALKPFLPPLQTTFVKCLQDNNRSVQTRAAAALGKLSALSTRVDPLVSDLLSMLQSGDESVKESVLSALKGVIKHAGKSVSSAIRSRGCALLEDLLQAQADDVRSCAAKVIGTLSQYMEETEISDLVQTLLNVSTSSDWCTRHGALLAFSSISMHSPSKLCHLASFPFLVDLLKGSLKDDKFPVREVATRTLGRILCFELQSEAVTLQLVQLLVLALRDDSSEVRRRSLSCIKAAAKINHSALATHHSILGPAIADALKDSSMPVRLAAERCALHVFQLTKGPDNVTTHLQSISPRLLQGSNPLFSIHAATPPDPTLTASASSPARLPRLHSPASASHRRLSGLHAGPGCGSCDSRAMEQDHSAAVGSADSGAAAFDFATGNPPSSAVTGGSAVAPDSGAQAADASAYQAEHTALNGTAGDMANYQTGAAENGEAVTNEMGEPVPEPYYEEAVLSAEEARLWSVVTANSLDFNAWTALIDETEKDAENNILKIRKVYDSFLAEFPLCFGYWKKYADHEARLDGVSKVIEVYERAVLAVTYSVDIWYNYCQFAISTYDDPDIIRRLFERGLAYVGTDYRSNILWDEYIKYEESLEAWSHLAVIYTRVLEHPIQQLDRYFNCLKELASKHSFSEILTAEEASVYVVTSETSAQAPDGEAHPDDVDKSGQPEISSSTDAENLAKYVSMREEMYKKAKEYESKIIGFELAIRRPYFHVKPLDNPELENWHNYLDFIEKEEDINKVIKLYERCVIACANYSEFWIRYVQCMEDKGSLDLANNALARATHVFVKKQPEIHLFSARFKELNGDISGARAEYQHLYSDLCPGFLEAIVKHSNMEHRLGEKELSCTVYEKAIAAEKGKEQSQLLPTLLIQYSRFLFLAVRDLEKAREILNVLHEQLNVTKPVLEAVIHLESIFPCEKRIEFLGSLVEKFVTPESSQGEVASLVDKEEISSIFLEFLDLFGDAKSIKKALTRHTTLFSCKRSILPSKKRKGDDAVVSDRDKFAKTGATQSATGTDPNASNPPVWPATSEASGQQWGASYAQQATYPAYGTYDYSHQMPQPAPQAAAYGAYPPSYSAQTYTQQSYAQPTAIPAAPVPAVVPAATPASAYPQQPAAAPQPYYGTTYY